MTDLEKFKIYEMIKSSLTFEGKLISPDMVDEVFNQIEMHPDWSYEDFKYNILNNFRNKGL